MGPLTLRMLSILSSPCSPPSPRQTLSYCPTPTFLSFLTAARISPLEPVIGNKNNSSICIRIFLKKRSVKQFVESRRDVTTSDTLSHPRSASCSTIGSSPAATSSPDQRHQRLMIVPRKRNHPAIPL